ncbi:MAG: transcriptional regulator [Bacteroidales bacterium]|jgi:transcriptional regulator with XRE-family HTH domain|nr:transcriptional regulator [Bacteroidales bacterium]
MEKREIHIGKLIRQKVKEKGLSISDFAALINRERSTAYNIFKQPTIDINRLISISKVLQYDFLKEVYLTNSEQKNMPDTINITIQLTNIKTKELHENLISKLNEILVLLIDSE